MDKCPKCGAVRGTTDRFYKSFSCGTALNIETGRLVYEGHNCRHNQLAAKDRRIAELESTIKQQSMVIEAVAKVTDEWRGHSSGRHHRQEGHQPSRPKFSPPSLALKPPKGGSGISQTSYRPAQARGEK